MHRRGPRGVFFGRVVAIVRTVVPLIGGASRMRCRTLLAWNAAGALIWSLAHVAAGYGDGPSWKRLESTLSTVALVGALLVGFVIVGQGARRPYVTTHLPGVSRGSGRRTIARPTTPRMTSAQSAVCHDETCPYASDMTTIAVEVL